MKIKKIKKGLKMKKMLQAKLVDSNDGFLYSYEQMGGDTN